MTTQSFSAVIKIVGLNPYVLVSAARATKLKAGWRKPLPVLVRINGEPRTPWRINMMPTGDGSFYLYLHGSVRQASNTKVGDRVKVEVSFDEKYRGGPRHRMPSWFSAALKKNEAANKNWRALPPSRKKEVLRYFATLKSPDARKRNVDKATRALAGTNTRFMGREWKGGR